MSGFTVHVFHSTTAPSKEAFVAFLYQPTKPTAKQIKDGVVSSPDGRLPMTFPSASKQGAIAKAEAWIAAERAKLADSRKQAAERAERARAARTPIHTANASQGAF